MDINKAMKKIVRDLGLGPLKLEKMYPDIKDKLVEETMETFSQYFPCDHIITVDLNTTPKRILSGNAGTIYYINDRYLDELGLDIISVRSVTGTTGFMDWNARPPAFNVEDILLNAASSSVRSLLNISTRSFEFVPPNGLRLIGYNGFEHVDVRCKIPYPNFGSIPISVSEQFYKLAFLDVKILLYPEVKLFENMETADGTIDLKLSDWEGAMNERAELLTEWMNTAYPQMVSRPYNYE